MKNKSSKLLDGHDFSIDKDTVDSKDFVGLDLVENDVRSKDVDSLKRCKEIENGNVKRPRLSDVSNTTQIENTSYDISENDHELNNSFKVCIKT